jgi:hypothetical protein
MCDEEQDKVTWIREQNKSNSDLLYDSIGQIQKKQNLRHMIIVNFILINHL